MPINSYIGTSRFDAHLDATGPSFGFSNTASMHMHLNYELFAEILKDVAKMARRFRRSISNIVADPHRWIYWWPLKISIQRKRMRRDGSIWLDLAHNSDGALKHLATFVSL